MLSIPDRFQSDKESVFSILKNKNPNILAVHRLDKDTSGVICFAKNPTTHRILNTKFENRLIQKYYLAVCESQPPEESGIIEAPIAHSSSQDGKMLIHPKGKAALTKFRIKELWRNFCLLELKPETGRTHQIRVHLAYIGCPILCDPLYGFRTTLTIDEIKKHTKLSKNEESFRPLLTRTALHASSIKFELGDEKFAFEAELPKDMKAVIHQLNKWQSL